MIIILIIIIIFIIIITIMVIIKQPVLNSQFSKPPDKLTTCTEKTTDSDFGPPFNAERYAQIDYWLTCSDWKSSSVNVQSRREIAFDSDHLVLESCVI